MIEKLKQTVRGFDDKPAMPTAIEFFNKINEIIELLNAIVVDVDGTKCVDGSKKPEPANPYAEQRRCIGKLCWFWKYDNSEPVVDLLSSIRDIYDEFPYHSANYGWCKHCRPVKPDEDIIYRGE